MITAMVALWVIVTHVLFPIAPDSKLNLLAPVLFNLAAISAIYLGIKAKKTETDMDFKSGLKTGISISLVYAISACIFFFVAL